MARMYPATLPVGLVLDKSQSEAVEVYNILAQKLDGEFSVFFRPTIDGVELEHDELLDCVILHSRYGFLAIKVHQGDLPPSANHDDKKLKQLPYSLIRMAAHAFIFGLKERGIRFYIPAPCCVIFPHHVRAEFEARQDYADYIPIFQSDFDDLQDKIIAMMPVRSGYASNWSVPDAVERIEPLLNFNDVHSAGIRRGGQARRNRKGHAAMSDADKPRIIYVVRAIDIFLAIVNVVVLLLLVFFMPESFAQKVAEFLKH